MAATELNQVVEKNKRTFIGYLFPMVIRLLEEIENIITELNNRTYQSRIVVTEEQRKRKTVKVHSVIPLTKEQILEEINKHNHQTLRKAKRLRLYSLCAPVSSSNS